MKNKKNQKRKIKGKLLLFVYAGIGLLFTISVILLIVSSVYGESRKPFGIKYSNKAFTHMNAKDALRELDKHNVYVYFYIGDKNECPPCELIKEDVLEYLKSKSKTNVIILVDLKKEIDIKLPFTKIVRHPNDETETFKVENFPTLMYSDEDFHISQATGMAEIRTLMTIFKIE